MARALFPPLSRKPRGTPCGGFTLLEVLVTLGVAGILLALVYQIFISQQRSARVQEEVADAQQNARVGVEELTRGLTSLGAGVRTEEGQVRILVAHPHELTFNADLSSVDDALAAGATPVPGAGAQDPYDHIPGSYASSPAETYRYYLGADGPHHTLYREMNGGQPQQVALLAANIRIGEPLFRYQGDFDGDGTLETLERVDRTSSPRVAAGEPLDAVIRRIDIELVTATPSADPRFPGNQGYRLTRLRTSVAPRNLWDCPMVTALPLGAPFLRAPEVAGTATPLTFRVTRGTVPEQGRTVAFSVGATPAGHGVTVTDASGTSSEATTDADGRVTALVHWPAGGAPCSLLPLGSYRILARTSTPPSLATPFGACAPHEAATEIEVREGMPVTVRFGDTLLEVASCGQEVGTSFELLDACDRLVRAEDAAATPVTALGIGPDPAFGTLTPAALDVPTGSVTYRSRSALYSGFGVTRSPVDPNRYDAWVEAAAPGAGRFDLQVFLRPSRLSDLTRAMPATSILDCPEPSLPIVDTFGVTDPCGNPLMTLGATGEWVTARLVPPEPTGGTIASPGNRAAFSSDPVDIVHHDGTGTPPGGRFAVEYQAPTCTVAGVPVAPAIELDPSWDGTSVAVETLPLQVGPCGTCSVQVLDASGSATNHLNRECDAEGEIVVTQCVPSGTTAELVIEPESGSSGEPSFDRNTPQERVRVTFTGGAAGQSVRVPFFIGTARSGDAFRVTAYIPDEATSQTLGGVSCVSETIAVDTDCSEILISPVADNPQAVPSNSAPQDTPLCAAEGSEVFFRVKDCDQNFRDYASDDIKNTAGTTRGLLVQVVDSDGTVLDEESPDLFEVNVHGNSASDSPYFQGILTVTQDPDDASYSGRLRAGLDRTLTLRAVYRDPDDPTDLRCETFALLVPPIPVCLTFPVMSWQGWEGDLRVRGGDAAIAGDLLLPRLPRLTSKTLTAGPLGVQSSDRFFNAYVGGTIDVTGAPLTPSGEVDQPFTPGGAGSSVSTEHPNYFQAVPDMAGLLGRLDYDRLKLLARALRVYWEPIGGGFLRNPATLATGTLADIAATPGPGLGSPTHDGRFLFVDAPPGLQSASQVDQASLGDLPVYVIDRPFYSEGLLYVAGSVVFATAAGQQAVPLELASDRDTRYDEDQGGITRADLPIDFAPAAAPTPAGSFGVNLRGALYAEGEVRMPAGPAIYGVLAAERGVRESGDSLVIYDPAWAQSRVEICSHCCGLAVQPAAPQVVLGDLLQLTANRPQGAVVWESLAPQVALVDPNGLVTPQAVGRAVIRAVDGSGCVAEVEVEVRCELLVQTQGSADLVLGQRATTVASGQRGAIVWEVEDPAVLTITADFGPTAEVEAVSIGGSDLTATDAAGCSASAAFTVNCPPGRILASEPAAPAPGTSVVLRVLEGGTDVSSGYLYFANGTALAGSTFPVSGTAPVPVEARLLDGTCPLSGEVRPVCPTYALTAVPNSLAAGQTATLAVTDPAGVDVTSRFAFTSDPPVAIVGNSFQTSTPGTYRVTGVDGVGCATNAVSVTVLP